MMAMKKSAVNMQAFLGFCLSYPKEVGLLVILLAVIGFVFHKATPPFVPKVIELKILKNKTDIKTLSQARDITAQKSLFVDKIMLREGTLLAHPKLGAIGFDSNFFIDVDTSFNVKKEGDYIFYPGSDDGFALSIDGQLLCEFQRDRAYQVRSCPVKLDQGEHRLKLSYFQGHGHSGLTLAYRAREDKAQHWFGEDSKYIKFD